MALDLPAAPRLTVTEALWLPPRRPNVLTVEVTDDTGALATLHASLVDALCARAAITPDARPLRPHITVARVRRGARLGPYELDAPLPTTFGPTALTLYSSRAGRYEPLASGTLL